MCLISVIPKGVEKDIVKIRGFIENGMKTNTHGSGYAYKKDESNEVYLSKGYLTPEGIINAIKTDDLGVNDELIIHHRIGTSGLRKDFNTHPFLISEDVDIINKVQGVFNLPVMAHNGVFMEWSDIESDFNDTFLFVKEFMSNPNILNMLKNDEKLFLKRFRSLVSGERLAFLFPDRDMILLGHFVQDDECFHSNTGYKSFVFDRGGSSTKFRSHGWSYHNEIEDHEDVDTTLKPPTLLEGPKGSIIDANIKFTGQQIFLTSENHEHFIMVPNVDITVAIKKNKGFLFQDYDEDALVNLIVSMTPEQQMFHLNFDNHRLRFDLGVKGSFRQNYLALQKFIKENCSGDDLKVSRSMLKKVEKLLSTKYNRKTVKFKHYGEFFTNDLKYIVKVNKELNGNSDKETFLNEEVYYS